jgi:SWI/SNF-related matrix-associated actin-dependent regulator 1 of chromatin subfamily A
MNFILPELLEDSLESLRAVFKAKGDSKVTLLAQERVSRAKKMMTPFVLRRRKDQARTPSFVTCFKPLIGYYCLGA